MFRSLKFQIYLLVFIPFITIAAVGMYSEIHSTRLVEDKVSELTRISALELEKKRLVTVVESAHSLIKPYLSLPDKSGMKEALALIDTLRYDDGTGYIFSYDFKGIRLQSGSGQGIGKSFWDSQDKKGNYIVRNIVEAGRSGSGFTMYYFVKPGDTEPSEKYSYSMLVPEWNIIISTGFYIDDVDKAQHDIDAAVLDVVGRAISESVVVFFCAFIMVGIAVWFAIRQLYKPLNGLRVSVKELASGEGDLTRKLPSSPIDLLDEIATDFNTFIGSMAKDISDLKGTSRELNQIASVSSEQQVSLEKLSTQQKDETVQVAAAIDEMSSTSVEISGTADRTRQAASSVETEMQNVLRQVQVSNQQLDSLNELMGGVEASINELGNNVGLIHSVLSVIQGISEQTNLLALNAAIEAARAGEQGRGFAVVADEVRNLAQRSQASTVEIKEILDKLQASAEKTVQDMAKSDEQRSVVIEAMARIREIIGNSNESIRQLAEMNVQVATSATEQSSVAHDIAERVNSIASLAEEIGSGSTQARVHLERLSEQSTQITSMTRKFTV
jgi:methyl-accepting chemotaxis protein